jgi:tetratricopeptide (TPR) repeat protein/HEAT repeat protein
MAAAMYPGRVRWLRPLPILLPLLLLVPTLNPPEARADFSAGGRKKGGGNKGGGAKGSGAKGGTKGGGNKGGTKPPTGGTQPPASPDDGKGTKKGGLDERIQRYTGILMAQPWARVPLERLSEAYRERDGNLKQLLAEFERRATEGEPAERWNARVALAGLFRLDGRLDDATKAYEAALAERPKEAQARLALAQLLQDRGDKAGARKQLDETLGALGAGVDRESVLRSLRTLAVEQRDFDGARGYQEQLVKAAGGSLLVRSELGRELLARGDAARAEAEFQEAARAAAGDNRALAPALLELGRAQAAQKKNPEALATLKRALGLAGSEAGVRGEILNAVAEVYRADNNLTELIGLLEKERVSDFPRLVMLGSLYEETGAVDRALETYRKALGVNGRHIETRIKVVRLLQAQGELEQAIAENEKLIQAAPRNPDFVFQLCEVLLQRGDRAKALGLLTRLEQSASNDEDTLARVADFYERIEERDRALKLFARLTSLAPSDPTHLVELGERYWQANDQKKALEVWNRLRTSIPQKARALSALGEVLLEHDQVTEALAALKEAMDAEPANLKYRKGYALALERVATGVNQGFQRNARFDEARVLWEELLEKAGTDRLLAREARTHVVTLWSLLKQLESRIEPLKRRLADDPPDLEAGRLLAEAQIRLRRLGDAESSLRRITEKAPGDEEAFLSLERVRVLQHDLPGAIGALEKLVEINPKRAREYYQRMAQYAAELYRDDDAVLYSEKAVALSPNDADGYRKLGGMFRRRGATDRAIQSFRQALHINDRLYPVYMELAELLVAKGEPDEADRLYRRVLRTAPDEELVAQAGRLSMQRNLVKGTLTELENDLLPLALGNPSRRVYRRLLIEVYGHLTFPLVQKVRFGEGAEAEAARAQLVKIGARGIKPLLDTLGEEQSAQITTAIDVLSYVGNRSAAPALIAFAGSNADQSLRVKAMLATGALKDPSLLPRYEEILAPRNQEAIAPGDPVAVAVAWSVARMGDRKALPLLTRMLSSGAPEVRALGALGVGLLREKKMAPQLEELARSPEGSASVRAAAALALGELEASASAPVLLALASAPDPSVRAASLAALARLRHPAAQAQAILSLFAEEELERHAAAASLIALQSPPPARPRELLPILSSALDLRALLGGMLPGPFSPQERSRALVALEPALARAAASAASSPEQASRVADALLARSSGGFAPFTDGLDALPANERQAAEKSALAIRKAVIPAFAALIRHPSSALKTRAIRVLEGSSEEVATTALLEALQDSDDAVVRAALAALPASPGVQALGPVAKLLGASPSWSLRAMSAEVLGALVQRQPSSQAAEVLARSAGEDSFAVVREASLKALAASRSPLLGAALQRASQDPEPALRALAATLGASR